MTGNRARSRRRFQAENSEDYGPEPAVEYDKETDIAARQKPKGTAMDAALRILGVRDHSVAEMEDKLNSRGFEGEEISEVVRQLLDYRYLDDDKFARLLARSNPSLGRRGLGAQMTKRGISPQVWRPIVDAIDDSQEYDRALEAARKHTSQQKILTLERQVWQRRLSGYLARSGFSMSVVYSVCAALQDEAEEGVSW
mgnify:CR=1 FL=1